MSAPGWALSLSTVSVRSPPATTASSPVHQGLRPSPPRWGGGVSRIGSVAVWGAHPGGVGALEDEQRDGRLMLRRRTRLRLAYAPLPGDRQCPGGQRGT